MRSLHDHYINGYRVDGRSRSIVFEMARPGESLDSGFSLLLSFAGVEGYFLEQDLNVSIVFSVEEEPIIDFLRENEPRFKEESQWGWPLFWKGSTEATADYLAQRGAALWRISSSYGLCGWVVAREARLSEWEP